MHCPVPRAERARACAVLRSPAHTLGPLARSAAACLLSVSKDRPVGTKGTSCICAERKVVAYSELCLLTWASCGFPSIVAGHVAGGLLVCKVTSYVSLYMLLLHAGLCAPVCLVDLFCHVSVRVGGHSACGVRRMHPETATTETCHHGPHVWYCPVLLPVSAGLFMSLFRSPANAHGFACCFPGLCCWSRC